MTAALPTITRTWKQLLVSTVPGARITYVSVLDAMQQTLYGLKNFLVSGSGATTKYGVVWSASGGTGPANSADATDRWTSASTITPRSATAGASQAWIVLLAGNARAAWVANNLYTAGDYVTNGGNVYICRGGVVSGTPQLTGTSASSGGPTGTTADITDNVAHWQFLQAGTGATQILIAFQGASDDIARISFSPGALFTLAGTTNQQPTATDEQVIVSGTTIVATTTSGDRILHVWASDDAHAFRCVVLRSGAFTGPAFGVEDFQRGVTSFPVLGNGYVAAMPTAVWGFSFNATPMSTLIGSYSNTAGSNCGGLTRSLVSGSSFSNTCNVGIEATGAGGSFQSALAYYSFAPELQASLFSPYPMSLHSNLAGARGRLGNLIDWWALAPSGYAVGDGFGSSYQFWQVQGALWPNPSNTAPTIA